ncbi:TMV resistance protein N-like isoform X2 [Lotus japonicus]|uniref:TMV resistance protein N-like isoform X2 n=1 Tax=Lotus japonicus TaxID=34305 RepID=UPI00258C52DE|nr:TMV resistance protein N-like isoform X2 [Lotus japonicus]
MADCTQNSKWKYHVFLSFRGEDTRLGFTDHLYAALVRKSIITFRDDEELARGEVISQKLLHAIHKSLSAIVIISKNYASSSWCLDELVKILETKNLSGQQVFPIFYGVDPSDVRNQRGSFAEAFRKHEEKSTENKENVQKWRDALREVANLSGWDSKDQHETELIEEVVAQVWKKLELKFPTYNDGLVAIDTRLEDLFSILKLGLEGVRFIGIWGMGGIGKTTLATALFKKIKSHFDVSCFIANVREVSGERSEGLLQLQNKILSHLNIKGMVIETLSEGKDSLRNLLSSKRVLLVLDDVSSKTHLENLAGNLEWFGQGSRIIVTTRDKHLLISHVVLFEMYENKILNKSESLQLLCEKAFKGNQPKEDYLKLSQSVVEYAGGLPLALEVLGSFLCGRSLSDWEDALVKMKQVPHDDILNKIRISYDMLEEEHKTIFLDIACFFKGWYKHKVIQVLDNCGLHPTVGINVLIEKSLVTFDGRVIGMHDLLEEMGKTIVFQESPNDPGRRSRLWSLEDIDQVLKKNKGTELVQGIVLKSTPSKLYEAHWDPEAFSKMCNLRLLVVLCDLHLPLGLKCLSSSLKVLVWWGYPLNALPLKAQLDELVHLQMINSKVKQLWKGTQYFGKLKVIDLSNSKDLLQTPNISAVPYLEELYLNDCTKLFEVHQSIGQHKKLMILSLMGCGNLKILPSKLEMCSLKMFFLSDCSDIERLPDFGENMTSVSVLNLMKCKSLLYLPDSISNLKSLRILNISGCSQVFCLPDNLKQNKALEDLDLSRTSIRMFDPFLLQLGNLKRLSFLGCSGPPSNSSWDLHLPLGLKLRFSPARTGLKLPPTVSGLSSLTVLNLSFCNLTDASIPPDIDRLSSLERLILSWNNFTHLPDSIANLPKLHCLELENCPELQSLPVLPPHVRLYASDSDAMPGNLLDPEKLWKLFESSDQELFLSPVSRKLDWPALYPVYMEIPPRLDTKSFFPLGSAYISKLDSFASVTVGIPDDCLSSDWWGVAVLVALDAQSPDEGFMAKQMRMYWSFDTEDGPSLSLASGSTANNDLYLFTLAVSDDFIYIRRHNRDDPPWWNREHFSKHRKPELNENSLVCFEVHVGGCKIRKCRWRVLRKEDCIEDLQNVKGRGQPVKTRPRGESKLSMDEFKGEDVIASEGSKDNFSMGKLFHNIRQGLGISMLALMAGTAMFLLPRQGLGSKQQTPTIGDTSKLIKSRQVSHGTGLKVTAIYYHSAVVHLIDLTNWRGGPFQYQILFEVPYNKVA